MTATSPSSLSAPALSPPRVSAAPTRSLDRGDFVAMAGLTGALVAMFWRVIFTHAMFFERDVLNYSFPHAQFIHDVCRQGHLPYWNPYLNYGEPLLANPNFLFFYPSTLFLVLLPAGFAYSMHYVAHFTWAAIGTYLLCRRWGQSHGAAFFAAFVFALSGPVLSLGNLYNHAACIAWIPWALLLTDQAIEGRGCRPWILLTIVFTLQFLAAEPFTLLATFGLSLAYGLCRKGTCAPVFSKRNLRIVGAFVLVGCAMVGLAAAQFFPSVELLSVSRRGQGMPFNETATWSFHPLSMLEVALPDFFGHSLLSPTVWTLVLSCRNMPYYVSLFWGFVPLFFALAGWAMARDPRRKFVVWSAGTLWLLSLGRFTPVFALAYLLFPPLELVRFPIKLLIPVVLLTAILAGWGVDALRSSGLPFNNGRRILRLLELILAGAGLVWVGSLAAPGLISTPAAWILLRTNEMFWRNPASNISPQMVQQATDFFVAMVRYQFPGLCGFALGGILWLRELERGKVWARSALPLVASLGMVQLALVNYVTNPTVPPSFYSYRPPVLDHFAPSAQPFRFCYIFRDPVEESQGPELQGFLNFESVPAAAHLSGPAQIAFRDRILLARGSMLVKAEASLNTDVERSAPPFLFDFWLFALHQVPDPARQDCLIGRTNVRYQVYRARRDSSTVREVAEIFNGSSQPHYLYENLCASPRAFVAADAVFTTSPVETLAPLSDPGFDPRREVFIAQKGPPAPPEASLGPPGRVEIIHRDVNSIALRSDVARQGYVVLLDRYDPDWHAAVDGHEVPVLRANLMFRAVRVGAGQHQVRFFYRQRGLRSGMFVSLATLTALLFLWVSASRKLPPRLDGGVS